MRTFPVLRYKAFNASQQMSKALEVRKVGNLAYYIAGVLHSSYEHLPEAAPEPQQSQQQSLRTSSILPVDCICLSGACSEEYPGRNHSKQNYQQIARNESVPGLDAHHSLLHLHSLHHSLQTASRHSPAGMVYHIHSLPTSHLRWALR